MLLSTMFQLKHGSQFIWWMKQEWPEKATDLLQVNDKLYQAYQWFIEFTSS
jgi:hypothetical protein